jgi:hypothetical protein
LAGLQDAHVHHHQITKLSHSINAIDAHVVKNVAVLEGE